MFKKFTNFLKEPGAIDPIEDEEEVKEKYSHFRARIFYSCFIGYIIYNICRKNIAVALPFLTSDFGYTNVQLGLLGSSLYITYGIGKFLNGLLADNADVRKFMPTALILSGVANICFALSVAFITPGKFTFFGLPSASVLLWLLAFFWGANGWFQSMGFPPIAKSLTYWFSKSERGTKWSIWSTSHQIGVFLGVIISGLAVKYWGFYGIFVIPALICIITGIWLFDRLRDKPVTLGLPEVEKYRGEPVENASDEEDNCGYFEIFKKYILFNKTIWLLAIAYVFVYIIRYGTEDWIIKYLVEDKGNTIELATQKLSFLAFAGIFGAILASVFSDKLFKGKRMPINLIFLAGVGLCIWLLMVVGGTYNLIDILLVSLIGFFTAGPQLLIGGLCAVESSSKKVASASVGFTGIFGYIGAVLSSAGTGYIVDKFSWDGAIWYWVASAVICFGICTVLLVKEYSCDK